MGEMSTEADQWLGRYFKISMGEDVQITERETGTQFDGRTLCDLRFERLTPGASETQLSEFEVNGRNWCFERLDAGPTAGYFPYIFRLLRVTALDDTGSDQDQESGREQKQAHVFRLTVDQLRNAGAEPPRTDGEPGLAELCSFGAADDGLAAREERDRLSQRLNYFVWFGDRRRSAEFLDAWQTVCAGYLDTDQPPASRQAYDAMFLCIQLAAAAIELGHVTLANDAIARYARLFNAFRDSHTFPGSYEYSAAATVYAILEHQVARATDAANALAPVPELAEPLTDRARKRAEQVHANLDFLRTASPDVLQREPAIGWTRRLDPSLAWGPAILLWHLKQLLQRTDVQCAFWCDNVLRNINGWLHFQALSGTAYLHLNRPTDALHVAAEFCTREHFLDNNWQNGFVPDLPLWPCFFRNLAVYCELPGAVDSGACQSAALVHLTRIADETQTELQAQREWAARIKKHNQETGRGDNNQVDRFLEYDESTARKTLTLIEHLRHTFNAV